MTLTLIVATDKNQAIGFQGKLLYWLPDDLKNFKSTTSGHTVLMGRKTFESLPKGALPNRRNIVLTRNTAFFAKNAECFSSIKNALKSCSSKEKIFCIGGEQIYKQAIQFADELIVTEVNGVAEHADVYFPNIDTEQWTVTKRVFHAKDEKHPYSFNFITYTRKRNL